MPTIKKIKTILGHQAPIYTLNLGEGFFLSSDTNGLVVKWDLDNLDNGKLLARLNSSVYSLYLEDNNVFIGQNFEGVHCLDIAQNHVLKSLQLTKAAIFDIKASSNYVWIALGDGRLSILDKKNLTSYKNLRYSEKSIRCLAICESRNEIAAGFSDNFIRIFDTNTFALKYEWQAHNLSVFTLCYSPNEQYLLSGSRDAHLKIWNSQNNYQLDKDIVAHLFTINHIAYSPDKRYFATCSKDKSIKIWKAEGFQLIKVIDKGRYAGHGTSVNKLLWLSANELLSCSDDQSISLWEISFEN